VLVFRYMQRTEQFLAPAPRLLGAAVVAAGLIGLAFALRRRPRPPVGRPAPSPRLALAGGALLTYAWGGFVLSFLVGRTAPVHDLGNAFFAAAAVALLAVAARRPRRERGNANGRGPARASAPGP